MIWVHDIVNVIHVHKIIAKFNETNIFPKKSLIANLLLYIHNITPIDPRGEGRQSTRNVTITDIVNSMVTRSVSV